MGTNYSLNKKSKKGEKLMKKLLSISMTVLLAALLIVSCSPEQKVEDGLALVSFSADERTERSLTRTNPELNPEDFFWSYTAEKRDSTGLTTGSESTPKAVKTDKGLSTVGPFSYGDWSFTLYGYADSERSQLAYKGTSELTINQKTNALAVTVESQSSGNDGYLEFPAKGTIALTGKSASPDYTKLVEKIYIKSLDDTTAEPTVAYDKAAAPGKTTRTFTLKAGSYAVTVSYLNKQDTEGATDVITYATDTIYVAVADYLTTRIAGDISENTGDVEFEVKTGEVKITTTPVTVETGNAATTITVAAAPVSAEETSTETTAQNTTISIPSGALDSDTVTATTVKATTTSYTREAAASTKPTFTIQEASSGTTTEAVVLGGLDIDLYVNDSTDKTTDFSGDKALTITTYIAKNLNKDDIVVKYDGPANADGSAKSDGTVTSYEPTTGKLEFTVDHLSSYYFVSKSAAVFNSTKQTAETSLKGAIDNADSGDKLVLMKDITVGETIDVKKSFSLDLNGKTIKATTRVFLIHGGSVSIDNGTIEAAISNKILSVIRVSCEDNCTDATEAISLTVGSNATIKGTTSYGVTAFGYKDATVNVYGKIESANPALAGQGDGKYKAKFILNVYDGASLTATGDAAAYPDAAGIYQPDNDGTLNIYGGTVTSNNFSAVEIRWGNANISGGTFKSNASEYSCTSATSGPTTKGAAIAVAPYKDDINVAISGGTFDGKKKLVVVNPNNLNSTEIKNVKVVVEDGVSLIPSDVLAFDVSGTYYVNRISAKASGADVDKSVWSGNKITNNSGIDDSFFESLDYGTYNASANADLRAKGETYKQWFNTQFIDTGKASYEEIKQESLTKNSGIILKVYNADLFASFDLIFNYLKLMKLNPNNWGTATITVSIDADLDLNNKEWAPINAQGYGLIFDFNNHIISNLKIANASSDSVGLFGVKSEGEIKNLTITNADVSAKDNKNVAIVVGYATSSMQVSNITVKDSKLEGMKYVGVVTGMWYAQRNIADCKVENVTATAVEQVGGIVGYIQLGKVTDCSVTDSTVAATVENSEGNESAGGIAGKVYACNGSDVSVTGNKVTDCTVNVGTNCPSANIGCSSDNYCGYICGGKYINNAGPACDVIDGFVGSSGTTIVNNNIYSAN